MKQITKIFLILISISVSIFSQHRIMFESSVQYLKNNFNSENNIYFYQGLRYQTQDFNLSLSVPLVLGGEDLLGFGNSMGGFMGSSTTSSNGVLSGLGDIYLNGAYVLLGESSGFATLSLEGYVKFPTAANELNIGTGEYDYLAGVSLSKFINNIYLYARFAYLTIGSNELTGEVKNPFSYSLSIGYLFGHGNNIILAYDNYSEIINGASSPEQIALGFGRVMSNRMGMSIITYYGLSEVSNYISVSMGMQYKLFD